MVIRRASSFWMQGWLFHGLLGSPSFILFQSAWVESHKLWLKTWMLGTILTWRARQ